MKHFLITILLLFLSVNIAFGADVFADRVGETTTTAGTGTISLAGAKTGFRTFVTGVGDGNTCKYLIINSAGQWEMGSGTVTDAATDTLSRDATPDSSSNAGDPVNFSSGSKDVYCIVSAEQFSNFSVPDLMSQAEAEAGTATTERVVNAVRLKQAVLAHETGGADDQTAIEVPITDSGENTDEIEVEGALAEIYGLIDAIVSFTWDYDYTDLINKPTIPDELSDLSDDATHRTVTDDLINAWNALVTFPGYVFGTGDGDMCEGDDSRLSDARDPNNHASNHTDGTDDIQSATNAQKGLATAAHIQAIEANTNKNTFPGFDTLLNDYSFATANVMYSTDYGTIVDLTTYPNADTDNTDDFSGSYNDLTDKPTNFDDDDVSAADLGAASDNIANDGTIEWEDAGALDADGNLSVTPLYSLNFATVGDYPASSDAIVAPDTMKTYNDTLYAPIASAWTGDSTLSTNLSYYGRVISVTAGETVAWGECLYKDYTDGKWYQASETASYTEVVQVICVEAGGNGDSIDVLREGYIRDDTYDWTVDNTENVLWKGASGAITETTPTTKDNWAQIVGMINTADTIFFQPNVMMLKVQ